MRGQSAQSIGGMCAADHCAVPCAVIDCPEPIYLTCCNISNKKKLLRELVSEELF